MLSERSSLPKDSRSEAGSRVGTLHPSLRIIVRDGSQIRSVGLTHLHVRELIKGLDTRERVTVHPRQHIRVRDAEFTATWPNKPVTVSETDVKHAIETLRLVGVACAELSVIKQLNETAYVRFCAYGIFSGAYLLKWFACPCMGPTPPCYASNRIRKPVWDPSGAGNSPRRTSIAVSHCKCLDRSPC